MIKDVTVRARVVLNNLKAVVNRKLCEAGFGGGIVNGWTELEVKQIRNGKVIKKRRVLDKVITDAFVNDIVDALQGSSTPYANFKNYKYHGSGTGTTAESASQTALVSEVESRVTGTQIEGSANQYKTVATITYSATRAITEHGLFNATTGGTLMDRTLFAAVNVINGDSIQFTFTVSFTSGG